MSTIHLHQTTTSTPEGYVAGLTDFGPGRSKLFGNSADEYLKGLGAFMRAVTELFGPEQARVAAEDWVDELGFVDILPEPAGRDWRSVTIAAAARLAKRLNVDERHGIRRLIPKCRQYFRPIARCNTTGIIVRKEL